MVGTSLRYICDPGSPAKQRNSFQLNGPWQDNLEDLSKSNPTNSEHAAFQDRIKPHRKYLVTTKI